MHQSAAVSVGYIADYALSDVAKLLAAEWPDEGWSDDTVDEFCRDAVGRPTRSIKTAQANGTIGGAILYEVHARTFHIHRLVVAPSWRRRGVGTYLIENSVGRFTVKGRWQTVTASVHERDLTSQLFFRHIGFAVPRTAGGVVKLTDENGSDWYEFRRRVHASETSKRQEKRNAAETS